MIPFSGEGKTNLLDLWDGDDIVIKLIDNMETLDSEIFEALYNRLDTDHQIEINESIREFANNVVGCGY